MLVLLIGAPGSGKSTTVASWGLLPTQVVSSDVARSWVSDDRSDQEASADAFDVVEAIVLARMRRRLLTVVDATNASPEGRFRWLRVAWRCGVPTIAVLLDTPLPDALAAQHERLAAGLIDQVVPAATVRDTHMRVQEARATLAGHHDAVLVYTRQAGSAVPTWVKVLDPRLGETPSFLPAPPCLTGGRR
jgi:predicted kinase